jgi:Calcineurin-like phosphoesterase
MTRGLRYARLRHGAGLLVLVIGCSNSDLSSGDESSRGAVLAQTVEADTTDAGPDAGTSINFLAQELLGRPSDHSIAIKAITDQAVEAYVDYGLTSGQYSSSTASATFADGVIEVDPDGLAANTTYFYRLRYRAAGSTDDFAARTEHSFVTQRAPQSTFTFDVQSDSHQGYAAFYTSALYGVTMQNIANDHPDMLFDLGDAVSLDDSVETEDTVRQKYQNQRTYFDMVGHSSSIFLVLGNHEREEGWRLNDFPNDVAETPPVLSANGRKHYFLNPEPTDFYSGNAETVPELDGDQLRGDYYAFEWGSALFVAIDPFWYTTTKPYAGALGGDLSTEPSGNRWDWTLGKAQYDWLTQTLAGSTKPFKFVLAHHPTGGTSDYVRGGVNGAKYCEWGGYDIDGTTYGFDTYRPGWGTPVQEVLAQNGVTAFIHGHDHLFAKEELNGVVYQECPQPADSTYGTGFPTNAQDYAGAVTLHNSGHLRFTVSPLSVLVEYVRAFLPGDGQNGSVAYSYTISPCAAVNSDGRACDDGNACTVNDACASGSCVGTPALACSTGGSSAGGSSTGGNSTGGNSAGGNSTGGNSTGGSSAGGSSTGGSSAGGNSTGGNSTGGSSTGGSSAGGNSTSGNSTGGNSTGGNSTGGNSTGGNSTGGSSAGGDGGETQEAASGRNDQEGAPPTTSGNAGTAGKQMQSGTGGGHSAPSGPPAMHPPSGESMPPGESGVPSQGGKSGRGGETEQGGAIEAGTAGATNGPEAGTGGSRRVTVTPAKGSGSRGCGCVVARDAEGNAAVSLAALLALASLGRRRGSLRRLRPCAGTKRYLLPTLPSAS